VAVVSGYVGVYNTIAPEIGGANSTVTYSRLKSSATMGTLILTLFVAAITAPGERIFVVPFDQYVYLAANRMPASVFSYYLPWHAVDPRIEARLRDDLHATRPPVVIFRSNELVNGQWLPKEYASGLYAFLVDQEYVPLDASSALLGDVLVRKDRLVAARESLATSQPVQAAAAQQQQHRLGGQ